jgi:signal transduction histidine kinase
MMQERNEFELKKEWSEKMEEKSDELLLTKILSSINIVSFERISRGKFKLLGEKPNWFSEIFSQEELASHFIELSKKFLFMEIFLEEARQVWKEKQNTLISSDLWTEENQEGKQYYLQAFALTVEERDILFIKMIDYSKESGIDLLQKARQKNLDYENLLKTERELEKILKFKEQFISIISHDLRSPVTAISGFSELLMLDESFQEKLNIEQKEIISFINLSVKRLLDYTKKIYHWSNLELGKFKLQKQNIDIYYFLREIENTFVMDLKTKSIRLQIDVPDLLTIDADETLFNQAITNLVGNAIKFTPSGGHVMLQAEKDKAGNTFIRIKDTGVGIKREAIKELFQEHFANHTKGTAGEIGSGLGLSIVKRILDAHHFKIDVKSTLGEGTEFVIMVPYDL